MIMRGILKKLSSVFILFLISLAVLSSDYVTSQAAERNYETANIDIVDGKSVRMPRTSTGVVVGGHQLNHDYVKILNINNGSITIGDESYTQGAVKEPWSTQEDAYVIKGQGTSANNITISPTKNEITVYLVDIIWNGQVIIGGNSCKVNIVLCGNNISKNTGAFINVSRYTGEVCISGLTGREDQIQSVVFTYLNEYYQNSTNNTKTSRKISIQNLTIKTNSFILKKSYHLNDIGLYTNNIILKSSVAKALQFNTYHFNNSDINFNCPINGTVTCTDSTLKQSGSLAGTINCMNSSLWVGSPITGVVNSKPA